MLWLSIRGKRASAELGSAEPGSAELGSADSAGIILETERRRLARDIHDRIGKNLSHIRQCLELHEVYSASDPDRAAKKLAAARDASISAMTTVSEVIAGIYSTPVPTIKDKLESLSDYVSAVMGASLKVTIAGGEERIPPPLREQITLIIEEAVHNAAFHSGAGRIQVRVKVGPVSLCAKVLDDGCGFDHSQKEIALGTGLTSMYERTSIVGGQLAIDTRTGAGTRVTLRVPLPFRCADGNLAIGYRRGAVWTSGPASVTAPGPAC